MTVEVSPPSLRELYEQALCLPPAQRLAWAEAHCGDTGRLEALKRMLNAASNTDPDLLDRAATDIAGRLAGRPGIGVADDYVGREIGGFVLRSVLGEGGSSIVFLGEREQGGVRQHVALKLFRRILVGRAEQRRFRRERHALAALSHPGIARYIDGGVTEAGLAYIALEHVDGVSITRYATQHSLDVVARVGLVVDVCAAVAAAHRALIVHRDLKPSNVLITTDGHVKLVDFGIAKFLDDTDEPTETQHRALTPAYAAPEQFSGDPITTATDVYALGVLLAEVLTTQRVDPDSGQRPSQLVSDSNDPTLLPAPPRVLRRVLRGDLDNVILKAVAHDAWRRYPSAEALAEDLQRYLDGLPVRAHPPSRWYTLRKFVQRNAVAAGITGAATLVVLASLVVAIDRGEAAKLQAQRAESTRDFLIEVFRSAEPAGPDTRAATVAEVTESAAKQARESTELPPEVREELLTELGSVLRTLGSFEASLTTLDAAHVSAAARLGPGHETSIRIELERADTLFDSEQLDRARAALERIGSPLPKPLEARRLMLQTLMHLRFEQESEALVAAQEAVRLCETECGEALRIDTLERLGDAASASSRGALAADAYERALAMARSKYGDVHARVAAILNGLIGAYRGLGRTDAALAAVKEIERIDAVTLPQEHWRWVSHLAYLAAVRADLGENQSSLETYQRALEMAKKYLGPDLPDLAIVTRSIGVVHARLGQYPEAIAAVSEALARQERLLGPESRNALRTRAVLGHVIFLGGDTARGRALTQSAVEVLARQGERSRFDRAYGLKLAALQALWSGEVDAAAQAFEEALQLADALGDNFSERDRWPLRAGRAIALSARGESAVRRDLEAILPVLTQSRADDALLIQGHIALADAALADGAPEQARSWLEALSTMPTTLAVPAPAPRAAIARIEAALAADRLRSAVDRERP
jgi:serine/threonine-protein kinase